MANFLLSTWEEPRKWLNYRKDGHLCDDTRLKNGRGEWNRTTDLYVPNVALYQAELHPDTRPK